jgi:exonuclease SbcC
MKPISLRMEAFGPYGGEASIDFEPLADVGLFVVSGPTGAGKSTIFDAMCFALYGSLSGARQGHADVRSHYASPSAECRVELVFDANGERWRVRRLPAQVRQKRRGSGTTERPADATLERWIDGDWHPDAAKVRDVSARCRELVGLSLEQFERVVLLPQGKFADVLNARTADRAELLRTLFGSEVFERVGDVLAEQARQGERILQGAAEQRDRFHRRAVEALDRADAELGELPPEIAAAVEAAAIERRRADAAGALREANEKNASDSEAPESIVAQLSLLDHPVTDPTASDDVVEIDHDPAERLQLMRSGPLTDLESVAASLHDLAARARSDLERAEAQVKAIEQRRTAAEELTRLDDQTPGMMALADQLQAARRVTGLAAAMDRRAQLTSTVQDRRRDIDDRWGRVRAIVADEVLGRGADRLDPSPSPNTLGSLFEQTAARLSAVDDLIAVEARRLEQQSEHASLAERVRELDTALVDRGAELTALGVERAALETDARALETIVAERASLMLQCEAAEARVEARRHADAAVEQLAVLDRRLSEQRAAADVAGSAIEKAAEEIELLDTSIEQRPAREAALASAERRVARRTDIERVTAELERLDNEVAELQARSDEVFAAFVRGTAPRLATELSDGSPCPVCGSCEHPAPADGAGGAELVGDVDVSAVEAAASAAAAAQARRGECRAALAGLVADAPDVAEISRGRLEADLVDAQEMLAGIDRAATARAGLVETLAALEKRLASAQQVMTALEIERTTTNEQLAGRLGELGAAGDKPLVQLDRELHELRAKLDAVDAAGRRQRVVVDRLETIVAGQGDLEQQREALRIDRATAAERLAHLAEAIRVAAAHRDGGAEGSDLTASRARLIELREHIKVLQNLLTSMAAEEASLEAAAVACRELVAEAGFGDEEAAMAASMCDIDLEAGETRHRAWVQRRTTVAATVAALDAQGLPEDGPDIEALRSAAIDVETRRRAAADALASIRQDAQQASADLEEVGSIDATTAEQRAHHELVRRVAGVVRGNNSRRLSLENWVLSVYLHDVVDHANLHLQTMSNGRYRLLVQDAPSSQVGQHGLDLVIDDAHTGRVRPSVSLSGGETFQASLALALGLADVVMVGRAGLHLDALFVDEGFGSLDADAVDQAISVLDGLRSRGSMVGVITHVEALKSALPVAIEVRPRPDRRGSEVRQVA